MADAMIFEDISNTKDSAITLHCPSFTRSILQALLLKFAMISNREMENTYVLDVLILLKAKNTSQLSHPPLLKIV